MTINKKRTELKEQILVVALKAFKNKGIKAVTMDDIANLLAISKRTLYETYNNKEALLFACISYEQAQFDEYLQNYIKENNPGTIELLVESLKIKLNSFSNVTPQFYEDLHKYTRIIEYLSQLHERACQERKQFFTKGVEEGVFHNAFDYDIVLSISDITMKNIMSEQLYKQYDMIHIFTNVILLYIRGICTNKGMYEVDRLLGTDFPTIG